MTRIAKLSEKYSLPAQRLGDCGVFTIDDLWECIGNKVDEGIARVVQTTPVDKEVLLTLLIADALGDTKRSYKPKPFGLWFGLRPVWDFLKTVGRALKWLWRSRGEVWSKV